MYLRIAVHAAEVANSEVSARGYSRALPEIRQGAAEGVYYSS